MLLTQTHKTMRLGIDERTKKGQVAGHLKAQPPAGYCPATGGRAVFKSFGCGDLNHPPARGRVGRRTSGEGKGSLKVEV